jgi:ABC-type branched-subunit amino acid transport system ATPase component/ABC-type branched-subunit amino acid transport system permease subunit
MSSAGVFLLTGCGIGAVYAALALSLVATYKATGVINFAAGAIAGWSAYSYSELRGAGNFVFPVVWIPSSVHIVDGGLATVPAVLISAACGGALGGIVYLLVFRPLRKAPVLAKVVASAGVMLAVQSLTVMRFGDQPRVVDPILSSRTVRISGIGVPVQVFWLSAIAVALTVAVALWFKLTRTGLAMRAAAENELTVGLAGFSPDRLGAIAWTAGSTIAGLLAVLAAPLVGLSASSFTLYVIPALACALVGRLNQIGPAVAGAFCLGAVDSELTYLSTKSWWPSWAGTGISAALPFVAIVIALFLLGKSLPSRDSLEAARLPRVPRPRLNWPITVFLVGSAAAAITLTGGQYRFGLITSMSMAVIAISIVLLTGLLGQVSLAQATFAGIGGFSLSEISVHLGIGFPWAPLLAALIAMAFGVLAALPALRIRGVQLAVVTLAMAFALEQFLFSNHAINGYDGNPVPAPRLFGWNLSVRGGEDIARLPFAFLCLAVLTLTALGLTNIMRSGTGRRFLAVRSNERAAASIGISVTGTKLLGFGMSAFLAGIGGTLVAYSYGSVSVDSFTTIVGVSWLLFAYLGGITSVGGALQASLFVTLGITYVIVNHFVATSSTAYIFASSVGLILSVIFNPEGIAGALRQRIEGLWRRWRPGTADGSAPRVRTQSVPPAQAEGPTERPATTVSSNGGQGAPAAGERSNDPVLELTEVTVRYGGLRALNQVTMRVRRGTITGLIGANGAGKTTLIDAVSGFTPYDGVVQLDGVNVNHQTAHRRSRSGLARTWQSVELFSDLSVAENLQVASERGTLADSLIDWVKPERRPGPAVSQALELVGLESHGQRFPNELSLGQQKLLNVARALVADPRIMLMDEPAAGLSSTETSRLGRLLGRIVAERDVGILLVEHDVSLVMDICDYVYVLDFGRLIAEGTPSQVRGNASVIAAYLGGNYAAGAASGQGRGAIGSATPARPAR